jgi:hypothetical protein
LIEEVLPSWGYGPIEKEKRRLRNLINAIALLRSGGVHRAGVIRVYHTRGGAANGARPLALRDDTRRIS